MGRVLAAAVAVIVAAAVACSKNGATVACQADAECPQNYACIANACTPLGSDGGVYFPDGGSPGQCANENDGCTASSDCCSGTCTNTVCTAAADDTQPSCVGLSALCQNDCCDPYTCVRGVCQ